MSDVFTLNAQPRAITGKKVSQLRREGITPIVVFGSATDPMSLQVLAKDLASTLSTAGSSSLIALQVEGETNPRLTLVRDVQRHVTRLNVIHADFLEVVMDQVVRSEVHVVLEGEPDLVTRREALIEQDLTNLLVEALPAELPSSIIIDCTKLVEIGDAITVADLIGTGNYDVLTDAEATIVRLTHMSRAAETMEQEQEEAMLEGEHAEEAPSEPEVITARRGDEGAE